MRWLSIDSWSVAGLGRQSLVVFYIVKHLFDLACQWIIVRFIIVVNLSREIQSTICKMYLLICLHRASQIILLLSVGM